MKNYSFETCGALTEDNLATFSGAYCNIYESKAFVMYLDIKLCGSFVEYRILVKQILYIYILQTSIYCIIYRVHFIYSVMNFGNVVVSNYISYIKATIMNY